MVKEWSLDEDDVLAAAPAAAAAAAGPPPRGRGAAVALLEHEAFDGWGQVKTKSE